MQEVVQRTWQSSHASNRNINNVVIAKITSKAEAATLGKMSRNSGILISAKGWGALWSLKIHFSAASPSRTWISNKNWRSTLNKLLPAPKWFEYLVKTPTPTTVLLNQKAQNTKFTRRNEILSSQEVGNVNVYNAENMLENTWYESFGTASVFVEGLNIGLFSPHFWVFTSTSRWEISTFAFYLNARKKHLLLLQQEWVTLARIRCFSQTF